MLRLICLSIAVLQIFNIFYSSLATEVSLSLPTLDNLPLNSSRLDQLYHLDNETFLTDTNLGAVTAAAGTGGVFQVGANNTGDDQINVSIAAVSSADLSLSSLDLTTDAAGAISTIDAAIASVSTSRGDLGAVQNRLESTISNLQVTSENLAASESRIRDTDVAAEMVEFTRSQILQQAGTAMLGQANAVPQSVLRLLG